MIYDHHDPDVTEKFAREFPSGRVPIRYAPGYAGRHESALDYLLDLHAAIEAREQYDGPIPKGRNARTVRGGMVTSDYRIGYE